MIFTVGIILKQLLIIVPTIIASTTVITGVINGALNVEKGNVKHLISWLVAIVLGILSVLTGSITIGLGYIDYIIGALFGLVAGGAANGLYDWPAISNVIDNLYFLFGHGETIRAKRAARKV